MPAWRTGQEMQSPYECEPGAKPRREWRLRARWLPQGLDQGHTANYVAVVLERAGVLELDRERPARVRLTDR
jgi:hypothetical protein